MVLLTISSKFWLAMLSSSPNPTPTRKLRSNSPCLISYLLPSTIIIGTPQFTLEDFTLKAFFRLRPRVKLNDFRGQKGTLCLGSLNEKNY